MNAQTTLLALKRLLADMQVTLIHRDPVVFPSSNRLLANKPVSLGRSAAADLRVSGEAISEIHVTIQHDGRAVLLRRVSNFGSEVRVNDAPVASAELHDGDIIQVGNTRVEVLIEGPSSRDAGVDLLLPPAMALTRRELPTGLVAYEDGTRAVTLEAALGWLSDRFAPLLLANFLAAGEPIPAWLSADDDLLKAAADHVGNNCLYLIAPNDIPAAVDEPADPVARAEAATQRLLDLYEKLRPRGAGVILFGAGSKEDVLKSIGFRRGFYASATSLQLFLRQGSPDLARGLIDGLHTILIADGAGAWTAYANPKLVQTAADLNLGA